MAQDGTLVTELLHHSGVRVVNLCVFSKALKGDREQCCSITRYLCFLLYEQDVRTGESGSVLKCSTEITKNSKYIFEFLKACEEWHSTGVMHIQSVQALAC